MTTTWKIYALVDPRTGEPRYIGQTRLSLLKRLTRHVNEKIASHKANWIKQLKNVGLKPAIIELYKCYDGKTADTSEIFFISDFKKRGFRLTNISLGGFNGTHVVSEETRAKLRIVNLGRPRSAEHRAKLGLANKGKKRSAETRAKLSHARLARPLSPEAEARRLESFKKTLSLKERKPRSAEFRAKLRLANIGKKHSAASKEKMRLAKLGKKLSSDTKARMSIAKTGRKFSPETIAKRLSSRRANKAARQLELTQCQPDNQTDG